MKKILKALLPAAVAIAVTFSVPYLHFESECSCNAPILVFGSIFGCGGSDQADTAAKAEDAVDRAPEADAALDVKTGKTELKVTFVEIGSVNCIPCKMMRPVMKAVEEEFPGQVKILFYDVWTPQGKEGAMKYGIRVIPTQVFLDKNNKEYFRHEGFFSQAEVFKVLAMKGVK